MNDDYLWDGSGEADPEIEKLEGLLGRYRSEMPAPALPETQVVPIRSRRSGMLLPIAAAAAIAVLSLGVGLWWLGHPGSAAPPQQTAAGGGPDVAAPPKGPGPVVVAPWTGGEVTTPPQHPTRKHVAPRRVHTSVDVEPVVATTRVVPLVDAATAGHIEQAELLLRSVRNASPDDADALAELAFDARQSQELLDQNSVLRRAAQTKRNVPVGQLLGELEPLLIDIANLGDRPSREDVRDVQYQIEQREMLSNLELYSMNRPNPGF